MVSRAKPAGLQDKCDKGVASVSLACPPSAACAGNEYEELAEDAAGEAADEDGPEAHFGLPGAEDGFGEVEVIED